MIVEDNEQMDLRPGGPPPGSPQHEPGKHPGQPPQPQEPGKHPGQPHEPHKPGKEGEEPEEDQPGKREPQRTVSMTSAQFEDLMRAVIGEARKPVTNEQVEARKRKWRERNIRLLKGQRQLLLSRFRGCNHMQFPGSVMTGCSAIAWATQSDGHKRGICMHCGTVFSSERTECVSEEVWQAYPNLVRTPTHPGGNINTVFQSA